MLVAESGRVMGEDEGNFLCSILGRGASDGSNYSRGEFTFPEEEGHFRSFRMESFIMRIDAQIQKNVEKVTGGGVEGVIVGVWRFIVTK